jgi:hypothetical protein
MQAAALALIAQGMQAVVQVSEEQQAHGNWCHQAHQ